MRDMKYATKKILLTGGGTAGSVSPLLAIANELRITNPPAGRAGYELRIDFLWLGTNSGLERQMVERDSIKFKAIASGKLRRYFSWRNFFDLFLIKLGFFQSFFIILKWRPDLVITAGSFVSVPVIWAAWILRVPIVVHQQDARPGLANKLMAPFARVVTVTFKESLAYFGRKAVWTGNITRNMEHVTCNNFNLKRGLPVVLIIGGGTGAMAINELVWGALSELIEFCQIIHVTGKNKISRYKNQDARYKQYEFLNIDQMAAAYAAADLVVSRAGMGVLTELSYLGKPVIIIPMPDSHQEDNAEIFQNKNAAIVLEQKKLTPTALVEEIKKLLADEKLRGQLGENIRTVMKKGANKEMAEIINRLISTI
jgi:UDP-N-acetylglucosamine--N-acetylmuramyl-(pentapeptide) pyrophosphoryl-undecaprenol N-acetylglucosamine transferase